MRGVDAAVFTFEHRNEKEMPVSYRNYASHAVLVTTRDSILHGIAVARVLNGAGDIERFMDYDTALSFYRTLVKAASAGAEAGETAA